MIKVDADGNKLWDQTFGGNYQDESMFSQQISDGGYIVTGWTYSYGVGMGDVWLIKTDISGNKLWDRTFGGYDSDAGFHVQQTSDNGYIITGITMSYGAGDCDVWLIKTSPSGWKQWDRTFGGSEDDVGFTVQQNNEGGYIIAGYTNSYGAGNTDAWLIKTDAEGNLQWDKTFGGPDIDDGRFMQQSYDGGYIVTGQTRSYDANSLDVLLIYYNPGEPVPPPATPLFTQEIALLLIFALLIFITTILLAKRRSSSKDPFKKSYFLNSF